jgi:multiple sugar transport system permease protein
MNEEGGARRLSQRLERPAVLEQVLTAPLNLLLWLLLIVPTLLVIWLALVNWQPGLVGFTDAPFVGVDNFTRVLGDTRFWAALGRTLLILVIALSLEVTLGFGLALLLANRMPFKRTLSLVFLYPMMLPWVVVGLVYYLLFIDSGPVTYLVNSLFGHGTAPSWLQRPGWAFSIIILTDVWQWTPFVFLVTYSGLLALPPEPLEAARTLGASWYYRFRYVVLPGLKQILIVVALLRGLELFKIFDTVFILTQGGPGNATETISIYLFRVAFRFNQLSFGAAMALIILVLVGAFATFAARSLRYRDEHEPRTVEA